MNPKNTLQSLLAAGFLLVCLFSNAQTIQLGSGTSVHGSSSAGPLNIYFRSMHMQIVYTKAELNAAGITGGKLTDLGFYVTGAPTHNLPNFKIGVAHTDSIDASQPVRATLLQAYTNASYAPSVGGFDMLTLDSSFNWNGTQNILIDVCFDRVPNFTSSGQVRIYTDNTVGFTRSDGSNRCGADVSSTTSSKPQLQMTFLPATPDNAGLASIDVAGILCAGSNAVSATIENLGNNQITALNVGWKVNGITQTPFAFSGTLDTINGVGSTTASVNLGSFNFVSGTAYEIKVFTYSPNGNVDSDSDSDTATTNVTIGLGGTYTIGGASPDYSSFTAAIQDLNSLGVCDAITFNVADGTYSEQLEISNIQGLSSTNTLTFQGASGDSSLAKVSFNGSNFSQNYTLYLDSVDYVTFKDLSFEATGGSYDRVLLIEDGVNHLTFTNCAIENNAISTPNGYELVGIDNGANSDHISFSNTRFFQGEEAFLSSGSNVEQLSFTQCRFINQRDDGLRINNADYLTIEDNFLTTNSTNTFDGFDIQDCDSALSIQRNQLINMQGGRGIYYAFSFSSLANPAIIANNFVHQNASSTSAEAIYLVNSYHVRVYHNTVNVEGSNTNNYGVFVDGGDFVYMLNNNVGMQGGTPVFVGNSNNVDSSAANNWYTTGSRLANWGGTNYSQLTGLQTATGMDASSISQPPFFESDTSFVSGQIALNNAAIALGNITTDIEGEARSGSTPDIGADEFTPTGLDAAMFDLSLPEMPFAAANSPVKAIIRNFGGTTITSVTLNWEVNGVAQAPANFSGSLATGDTASVSLGNVNFTVGTIYTIKVYTSAPNGGIDNAAGNDTLLSAPLTPALIGTYTIGGASPDFTDFNSATAALNLGGTIGHVNFNVRSGTYNERIEIKRFPQSDTTHTVTYRSETGDSSAVSLNASYTNTNENYVVFLNGARNVSFEDMHIENLSTNSYSRVVVLDSGATNIQFLRSSLIAGPTTSSLTSVIHSYNTTFNYPDMHGLVVDSCLLENGYRSIYRYGNSGSETGFRVSNSRLDGFYRNGIYTYNQDSILIEGNYLEPRSSASSSTEMIYVFNNTKGLIRANQLIGSNVNKGIYLQRIQGTSTEPFLVTNNFIVSGGSSSIGRTLELGEANQVKVVHNNLLSVNTSNFSSVFNDDYWFLNGSMGVEVLNNNFIHLGNGYAIAVDHSNTTTSFDYNNLQSSGVNLTRWESTDQTNLGDWQVASSMAANSISFDPGYTSNTDLHTSSAALNGTATPLTYVTTDIDGALRDVSTPDIGADEFTPIGDDVGVVSIDAPSIPFTPGSEAVRVTLFNNGGTALTSVTLNWTVNGQAQPSTVYTDSIASGALADSILVGSFNFQMDTIYSIKVWASAPNGQIDLNPNNDTVQVDGLISALEGIYTVGGMSPDFTDPGSAATALKNRGISGNVYFKIRDGQYSEIMTIRGIRGSSATDSIVFESESGLPNGVSLFSNSFSDEVLTLKNAAYLSFKNLHFRSTYAFNGQGVLEIDSAAHHIRFQNCVFEDSANGSNGDLLVNIGNGYNNDYLTFNQCTFLNGQYAINIDGISGTDPCKDVRIINSTFRNQYFRSIYINDASNILIQGDTIYGDASSSFTGMYIIDVSNGLDILNNVLLDVTSYGIRVASVLGSSTNPNLIANNFVLGMGTGFDYGISLSSCSYTDVIYNSVRSFSSNSFSTLYEESFSNNGRVFNNIFQHEGQGRAADFDGFNNYEVEANNYFSNGSTLLNYRATNYTDFTSYQAATVFDTASVSADALFIDSVGVAVQGAAIDGKGLPFSAIQTDIQGQTRDVSTPDIGADEISLTANDASIQLIAGPTKPFARGLNTVYVRLLNNGVDTLRSVQIEWSVNDTMQTRFSWAGTLASGAQLDSLAIGTFDFNQSRFYEVVASTQFPNGLADGETSNDTASVSNLFPALAGGYTIGATGADFPDFTTAVEALKAGGIIAAVNFNVFNGTYTEQVILPEIDGVTAQDTILFRSLNQDASLVTLQYDAPVDSNYVVYLNRADYISFDQIGFSALNSTYGTIVSIASGATHNRLSNCQFTHPNTTNFSQVSITANGDIEGLSVLNNSFNTGYGAVYINGINSPGVLVEGNTIQGYTRHGLWLLDLVAPQVTANHVRASATSSSYYGLYLSDLDASFRVTENQSFSSGGGTAIFATNLDGNTSFRGLVANNFASIGDTSVSNSSSTAFYFGYGSNVDVVYNSTLVSSDLGQAVFWQGNASSAAFVNNIASASAGAFALYRSGSILNLDYNNYYSTGNAFSNNGTPVADLTAWQGISSQDANSLSIDPLYVSASDLHISSAMLDSSATPLTIVTTDIDGEQRDANFPVIGADEASVFPDDLALQAVVAPLNNCEIGDSVQFTVKLVNRGSNSQSNFDLTAILNNDTITANYPGSLGGGSSVDFTFPDYLPTAAFGSYSFKAFVTAMADNLASNDTIRKNLIKHPPIQLTISDDTTICSGEQALLRVSGASSYQWNNGRVGASIYVSPSVTTQYIVTATDVNGCVTTDSVSVIVENTNLSASISTPLGTTICAADSLMLIASIDSNIIWSTGETDDTIYVKTGGTYLLSYSNPGSRCDMRLLDQVQVNVTDDAISASGFTTICSGESITLSVADFVSGTWSTGATSQAITISPLIDTLIYNNWTGTQGCNFSDSIQISVIPAAPPAAVTNLTPLDGTLNLSNPVALSWSPAAGAVTYDLYYWKQTDSRPATPNIVNINSINTSITGLSPAEDYYWQIASRNSCFSTLSDTMSFSIIGQPDLTITSFTIPRTALSGTDITVSYTVKNQGTHSTGSTSWDDHIWLSSDEDLRIGDDDLLIKVPNLTYLDTGQSYTNTVTVSLPTRTISTRLVFVSADNDDAYCATPGWVCVPGGPRRSHKPGMKELDEENNYAYDTLFITPAPAPDLIIEALVGPATAFSGAQADLATLLKNKGDKRVDLNTGVGNCYYISPDSLYNSNAVKLNRFVPPSSGGGATGVSTGGGGGGGGGGSVSVGSSSIPPNWLDPDSTESILGKYLIPNNIFGRYYIHAIADCGDNVFEALGEQNNVFSSTPINITLSPPADLQVDTIISIDTVNSGNPLPVSWQIINTGGQNLVYSWADSVYLCSTDTFNIDSVVASGTKNSSNPNFNGISGGSSGSGGGSGGGSGSSVVVSSGIVGFSINIPNGISGDYYLYVKADARNQVFEFPNEDNNLKRRHKPVHVKLTPSPDLVITAIDPSETDTLCPDSLYSILYTLKNQGVGVAKNQWKDRLYMSTSPIWSGVPNTQRASYTHLVDLGSNDSVTQVINFTAPSWNPGVYYFHLVADGPDDVFELNAEGNNVISSTLVDPDGVYLKGRPVTPPTPPSFSDVALSGLNGPANANSGTTITVDYTLTNNGPDELRGRGTVAMNFYLSSDNFIDNADIPLTNFGVSNTIASGNNVMLSRTLNIPNGVSGSYYILGLANAGLLDTISANDTSSTTISITLTPPADLVVTQFSLPTGPYYAGQQLMVPYTINNQGTGSVSATNVQEVFYLSGNTGLAGATAIGNKTVQRSIPSGGSYNDTLLISLPAFASGNYYLILGTDISRQVYEGTNETNNTSFQSIFINPASLLLNDLKPTALVAEDTLLLGYEYQWDYDITNLGSVNFSSNLRNGVYLAQGNSFNSATDELIAVDDAVMAVPSGDTISRQVTERVQGVNFGLYKTLLRLNIGGTTPETDLSNNDTALSGDVYVDAEALTLGVASNNTLSTTKGVYYKVLAPAGADMRVSLNSSRIGTGINELYVAYNQVPTPLNFDLRNPNAQGLDHDILISNTQAGYYYILATSQTEFYSSTTVGNQVITNPTTQSVDVLAELLPFGILAVSPSTVGQGIVTTNITGAGFRDSCTVTLESGGATVATATISNFVNSTDLDVTWDLTNVALGTYDLRLTNPDNSTTVLSNGLTVEASTGYSLELQIGSPGLLRSGKTGFYTFFISNDGNVDIPYTKGDVSVPDYIKVNTVTFNDPSIFGLSDFVVSGANTQDWKLFGNVIQIPFTIKDLQPGETVTIDANFGNFLFSTFPHRLRAIGAGRQEFVEGQALTIETLRQQTVNIMDSLPNSQLLFNLLHEPKAWRDSVFTVYINAGLLDPSDTVNIAGCSSCGAGSFDYSPGSSPGVAAYNKLVIKESEKLLWEINDPYGTAGGRLGWDIMSARDSLVINATAANPFEIHLRSLSSWDNQIDFLTSWSPGYDIKWGIMSSDLGIKGFSASKFSIIDSGFTQENNIYGGSFFISMSSDADTIYLNYQAPVPAVGQDGLPGGPGQYGRDGGRGGPGGPCGPGIAPGKGGPGGPGGPGVGGYLAPGNGGAGGPGGSCSSGNPGGTGGIGGAGGPGGNAQNGGQGGPGGPGGGPAGPGGDGGDGGAPGPGGGAPGPGGPGGPGAPDPGPGPNGPNGPSGPSGPNTPPSDPPGTPNNPNPLPPGPTPPPGGPAGGPNGPFGPGSPPSPPGGGPSPAGCGNAGGGSSGGFCDFWNKNGGAAGCAATYAGCGENIISFTVLGCAAAGGPWGCVGGALIATAGCGLGLYNCHSESGGNAVTNCAEALFNIAALAAPTPIGVAGAGAAGGGCASKLLCDETPVTSSCDPNEIEGPEGYGAQRFVNADDEMPYTIYFENDSLLATTAAQVVTIRQAIDPNMDPFSLKLTGFGFANLNFQIPGTPTYTNTVDVTDSLGVDVRLTAGVDVVNNEFFWIFESINKQTGVSPYDPLAGFLAVNDSIGSGEGYVTYTIKPKSSVVTGDTITAQADIIFDINSTITTNKEVHTIDAGDPTSTMVPLLANQDSTSFDVGFTSMDDAGGSGVNIIELYVSEDNKPTQFVTSTFTDSTLTFTGKAGSQYRFFTLAVDNVGRVEQGKTFETSTVIQGQVISNLTPIQGSYCGGDTLAVNFDANGASYFNLALARASDSIFMVFAQNVDTTALPYKYALPDSLGGGYYLLSVSDTSNAYQELSDTLVIGSYPNLGLADTIQICEGDTAQIMLNEGINFTWSTSMSLSDSTIGNPMVYPSSSSLYKVMVDDGFGCSVEDSVYVEVLQKDTVTQNLTVCDSYTWPANGTTYGNSGMYSILLTNQNGCDSLVQLNLTVNTSDTIRDTVTACDSYVWAVNNMSYTSSGQYMASFTNQANCDSVHMLALTINQSSDTTQLSATACDQFFWQPSTEAGSPFFILDSTGVYYNTLQNQQGCDSTLALNLTINRSDSTMMNATACDVYTWSANSMQYDSTGTYYTSLTNAAGCDSVVALNLTINNSDTIAQNVSACDSYTWPVNGSVYTSGGLYSVSLTNTLGCDSIVELNLTINNSDSTHQMIAACDSYTWSANGVTYTNSGMYSTLLSNAAGCDSVVSLDLTINQGDSTSQTAVACDSYVWSANAMTYTTSGVYSTILTNALGCDSVVTLDLTINTSDTITQTLSACDSYTWSVNGSVYSSSGLYSVNLQNAAGCDSVVELDLTINSTDSTHQQIAACDSYTWSANGNTYTSSGLYTAMLMNMAGCDSLVSLDLTINQGDSTSETAVACDSYVWGANATTYTASGMYSTTLTNTAGCDSVVSLNLTINSSDTIQDTAVACEAYTWSVNGVTYNTSGDYMALFTKSNGCDSIMQLNLTINGADSVYSQQTACGSFTWSSNGMTYNVSGLYSDTLTNANGCDSVLVLDLTISQGDTVNQTLSACDSYTWPADGSTYTTSGLYAVTLQNTAGCDSVVQLNLTVNSSFHGNENATACNAYTWPFNGQTYTMSGTYSDTLTAGSGCDSSSTLSLIINTVDTAVTLSNFVLTAQASGANVTYQWLDCTNGFVVITGETNQSFAPANNGDYAVVVSENGCTDTSACVMVQGIGLVDVGYLGNISLFPNPTEGAFRIELSNSLNKATLIVRDIRGRIVSAEEIGQMLSYTGELKGRPGVYMVEIHSRGAVVKRFKVMKL